ncbi:hypothetical protein VMCG_02701 [Cytospora schulzeri]|uniref:Uncharacterized protein n=1 Tax=Cytospora schulzeri TaxID=448051 RepID=A0A423WZ28_9PEZI|nr:hypothetical protein VMCG_02701 [Valsa malicola]
MADRYGHPRQTVFGRRHASAAATVSYSSVPPQATSHQPQEPSKLSNTTNAVTSPAPTVNNSSSNSNNNINAGVRRNLFQSQLTRRPTGPGPNETAPGRFDGQCGGLGGMEVDEDESASSDIVVRDKNGDVELDEPPALVVDDPDEIVLDMRQENEKERQRLADAVKHHQINQNSVPAQPEELLEAVKASLRAKVAALAEDNWMYEKEDEPRVL